MRKIKIFLLLIILIPKINVLAQYWDIAPEIWSDPVLIDTTGLNQKWKWYDSPCMTNSMDTIFFTGGNGVFSAIKKSNPDTANWEIKRLNQNVNPEGQYAPTSCSISRDGKRLYLSNWGGYGGLDLWKSEWDDSSNDWGSLVNMGEIINKKGSGAYLYEVHKDTVYCIINRIGLADLYYFIFNKQKNEWEQIDSLFHSAVGVNTKFGVSLTSNKKKLYSSHFFSRTDNSVSLDSMKKRSAELSVSYWDNNLNTWGEGKYLNINSLGYFPDPIKWPTFVAGGVDVYPWISEDGKALIFSSVRNVIIDSTGNGDTNPKLYMSFLQKDENGNPVSVHLDYKGTPSGYIIFPNYPNPFNGSTIISYNIPFKQRVIIKIYDILGKEVSTILDEVKPKGMNTILFNPQNQNLTSGVYIYSVIAQNTNISKSMIYLK